MRYFVDYNRGNALLRLREGEALILAEGLWSDGRWHQTDNLFKEKQLGKDYDYVEISPEEFTALLGDRVIASDEPIGRPDEVERERLTGLENRIGGINASVPTPPGAAGITAESLDDPIGG